MPDLPPLLLGLIITAYWARVLRLVYKARRRTGRSANFRPPERLGRLLRVLWYPAVIVWIAHPYVVAFAGGLPRGLAPLYSSQPLGWLAVVFAGIALVLTLICWKRMGRSWRMGIDPGEKTQLIVSGPYAYVRHPIYALSSVLMIATMVAIPSPVMLAAGLVHLMLMQWEAIREERHLAGHHGDLYLHYCRGVGRFLPRSARPYRPEEAANAINRSA